FQHAIHLLEPAHAGAADELRASRPALARRRPVSWVAQLPAKVRVQHVASDSRFTGAGNSGDHHQSAERDAHVCAAHVVQQYSLELQVRRASIYGAMWLRPVVERVLAMRSFTVPSPTTSPPSTPAPGPRSSTWSARRMVSSSCSTTTSVLRWLESSASESRSTALSRGCSPIVGSSRT